MMHYLPKEQKANLPMFTGQSEKKSFESEREILYSVLFDMRRDITELKKQLESLRMSHQEQDSHLSYYSGAQYADAHELPVVQPSAQSYPVPVSQERFEPSVSVVEEYVEEAMSLDDMEKKAILLALERNKGKRRNAAKELNISERTLYRKIKEYGIE
jgi:DNA-binding NtrC family response regulator